MSGLEAVLSSGKDHGCTEILVMLDNITAVKALQSGRATSSVWRIEHFSNLVEKVTAPVTMNWIPGHAGIPENEVVDRLAGVRWTQLGLLKQ